MSLQAIWFDCPECGEVGTYSDLNEHPTRPIATDIGFCPKCGCEIDELLTGAQIRVVLADYAMTLEELLALRALSTPASEGEE